MSQQTAVVREATEADNTAIAEVCRLATEDLRTVYRPGPSLSEQAIGKPMSRLVADIGGTIVGTVRYCLDSDRLHIIGLMVHPCHQRKGVARRLVESLAEIGRASGAGRLSLFTVKETGNIPVFENLGFRVVRETAAADLVSVSGEPLTEAYMEWFI